MDDLTPEQRRKNMQHIRAKNTKIEFILRRALWKKGYRYKIHYAKIPGKPDIVLTKYKIAIFCDGEFFHGKDWEIQRKRIENSNNSDYWIMKIERNISRDEDVNRRLKAMGWVVLRFWGKDIKNNTDSCIKAIEEAVFDVKMGLN